MAKIDIINPNHPEKPLSYTTNDLQINYGRNESSGVLIQTKGDNTTITEINRRNKRYKVVIKITASDEPYQKLLHDKRDPHAPKGVITTLVVRHS